MDDGKAYTPNDITKDKTNIKFKIPLYQRLFAWNNEQIKGLLFDLYDHFRKEDNPYYLGIITCIKNNNDYEVVIDGQQRLTVLMLMAAVFATLDNETATEWRSFLVQEKDYYDTLVASDLDKIKDDDPWSLRLLPFARKEDKKSLLALIVNQYLGVASWEVKNSLMQKGIQTIRDFIQNKELFKSYKLEDFSKDIFDNLTLLCVNLDDKWLERPEILNRYFEIINSNYKNLEHYEKLKTLLLKDFDDESVKGNLLKIWNMCENFSRPLVSIHTEKNDKASAKENQAAICTFKNFYDKAKARKNDSKNQDSPEEENKGPLLKDIKAKLKPPRLVQLSVERSIVNFPQFLLLALNIFLEIKQKEVNTQTTVNTDMKTDADSTRGKEERERAFYNTDKLLEIYGFPGNGKIASSEKQDFYDFIFNLRCLLDFYVLRRTDDNEDSFFVICGSNKENDETEISGWGPGKDACRLAQYQAMLEATFQESSYKWLKPYLLYLYEQNFGMAKDSDAIATSGITLSDLLKWLKNWDDARLLQKGQIDDLLKEDKLKYPNVDRYWFWRLDYYLWEKSADKADEDFKKNQKDAIKKYRIRSNRSIEHLFPQHPDVSEAREWLNNEKALQSFGNLAMISSSFNSTQGNDPVHVKFSRIENQIARKTLQSLKLLEMYNLADGNGIKWTPIPAKQHEGEMINILKNSFNRD